MDPGRGPVFFDARGRRARVANGVLLLTAVLFVMAVALLAFGVVIAPKLPALYAAPTVREAASAELPVTRFDELPISTRRTRIVSSSAVEAKRFAFFDGDDAGSFPSLIRNGREIDALIPAWLELALATGLPEVKAETRRTPAVLGWLSSNAQHVEVYPQLSSKTLGPSEVAMLLGRPQWRSKVIEQIAAYLHRHQLAGVTIDLVDNVSRANRRILAALSGISRSGCARRGARRSWSYRPLLWTSVLMSSSAVPITWC
jgi:hypothetical protein